MKLRSAGVRRVNPQILFIYPDVGKYQTDPEQNKVFFPGKKIEVKLISFKFRNFKSLFQLAILPETQSYWGQDNELMRKPGTCSLTCEGNSNNPT